MAWITDMTHFLDAQGRILKMPAAAAQLADYFGAIVAQASGSASARVRCRRRPGHRSCPGQITPAAVGAGRGRHADDLPLAAFLPGRSAGSRWWLAPAPLLAPAPRHLFAFRPFPARDSVGLHRAKPSQ